MEFIMGEKLQFFLRWLHIYFGVIWIGLLYYFNFVHGAFMKEAEAAAKPSVVTKLLPRALWWFRWAALWTMVTGIVIIGIQGHQAGGYMNEWGAKILTGAILGLIMGSNVWFVIWPNQKIVIKNAEETAAGRPALPNAAAAGAKALLASRTNTLLSVPMLFFMAASRHVTFATGGTPNLGLYLCIFGAIAAVIELNGLKGKLGPIETVKGVIGGGFVLTAILYAAVCFTF